MNILISQTASLGDVILSTPIIAALQRAFPKAKLSFLSTAAGIQLLKSDPRLSSLLAFDKNGNDSGVLGLLGKAKELRRHSFDLVFAIQRSARVGILLKFSGIKDRIGFDTSALPFLFSRTVTRIKATHEVERNISILAGSCDVIDEDKDLKLFVPPNDKIDIRLKEQIGSQLGSYLAIFPGSLWHTKRWSPLNIIGLARKLKQNGVDPYFFGSAAERELVDHCATEAACLSFAGRTSLQDLLYVVANSKLVICNDSSALHIAAAFKIPNLAIFCATTPEMGFSPWRNPNAKVIEEQGLWCRPCSRHGGTFCPSGTEFCMKGRDEKSGVGIENVFEVAKEFLGI